MKHLKSVLFTLTLFISMTVANAQVGHINSDQLLESMPETTKMRKELNTLAQNINNDYTAQVTELKAKLKKYGEESATKSNDENEKRQMEVAQLEQKLKTYLQSGQEELQKKELEMIKPIIEKAQKAIKDVAKEKKIKYVLDSAPGKGLIVFEGEDLMAAVKAKLGI